MVKAFVFVLTFVFESVLDEASVLHPQEIPGKPNRRTTINQINWG